MCCASASNAGYEHGVPAMAELVRTLKAPQLQRMERRYRKGDEEFRDEYLQADRAERLEESNKRARSRAEMVYGRLNDAQLELLAQGLAASPFDPERWLAERRLRQREIVDTLRVLQSERADSARTQAALRLFAAHAAQSPRQPYRDYQKRLLDHNCQLDRAPAQQHHARAAPPRRRQAQGLGRGPAIAGRRSALLSSGTAPGTQGASVMSTLCGTLPLFGKSASAARNIALSISCCCCCRRRCLARASYSGVAAGAVAHHQRDLAVVVGRSCRSSPTRTGRRTDRRRPTAAGTSAP